MTFDIATFLGRFRLSRAASSKHDYVHGVVLLLAASACGSGAVDVGALPNPEDGDGDPTGSAGSAGASSAPDAGGGTDPVSECSIPGLDLHRLVFDSDQGRLERRIYSMRADGSDVVPLTSASVLAREPAVSPDGSVLAYSTIEGVEMLDINTGSAKLFLPLHDQPAWSPDGSKLLASGTVYDSENAEPIGLGVCGTVDCGVAWSSDGSAVVFPSASDGGFGTRFFSIVSLDVDLRESYQVVSASATRVDHPTPAPDGVWFAAVYGCPGESLSSLWVSPYAIPTPACEGRRITQPNAPSVTHPSWGPGVLIAYERGEPPRDIAIIAADTGEECVIEMPGDQRNPSWMPESTFEPQ